MSSRRGNSELRKAAPRFDQMDCPPPRIPKSLPAVSETPAVSTPPTGSRLVSLRHHPSLWLGPTVLLAAALLPWPYGYYVFLRLVVFAVSAWIVYEQWKCDDAISGWAAAFAVVALLYNPVLSVHLTREIWAVLNVVTAVLFVWHFRELRRLVARLSSTGTPMHAHSQGGQHSFPGRPTGSRLPRK